MSVRTTSDRDLMETGVHWKESDQRVRAKKASKAKPAQAYDSNPKATRQDAKLAPPFQSSISTKLEELLDALKAHTFSDDVDRGGVPTDALISTFLGALGVFKTPEGGGDGLKGNGGRASAQTGQDFLPSNHHDLVRGLQRMLVSFLLSSLC